MTVKILAEFADKSWACGYRSLRYCVTVNVADWTRATAQQPSLATKRVLPPTLHTSAMHLLQSGVPAIVIALWLGHESTTTTHRYVEADLAMKERALARLEAPDTKMGVTL